MIPIEELPRDCTADDPASPAAEAGILPGDEIVSFNGTPFSDWDSFQSQIRANADGDAVIEVRRDDELLTLTTNTTVTLRQTSIEDQTLTEVGFLGVQPEDAARRPAASIYTADQMGTMTVETVQALGQLPVKVYEVGRAIVGLQERDPESPVSIVGGGRFAGEAAASDAFPLTEKLVTLLFLIASFNFFIGMFNFVPLLPLDGGHIAGALYEGLKRGVARLRGRPDPGHVDVAKLLPVAYVVGLAMLVMGVVLIVADIVVPLHLELTPRLTDGPHDRRSRSARLLLLDWRHDCLSALACPLSRPPVLAPRRKTRQIKVGSVGVGSDSPISVQSMTTTLTSDVNATLQQIAELTATGCDIVRVACPSQDDADALAEIAQHSQIPVIADIHFQPKYVFAAIDAGCAAVRVNPGNIRKFDDQVKEIARAAKDRGTSIRIGVNAGSLDKRILDKYGKATPEALVESAVWEAGLFEEHDFHDFKISVKHNDPVVMVRAYELLAAAGDWPLHLGVTEAGPAFQGTIKSSVAFGHLLGQGIGDTIRVSLSAPPVEEVKVGLQILESLNLKPRRLEIVSCPSCGRAQVDVYKLAEEVTAGLDGLEVPLRVAVMGCVVNGPGEAREADLGVASGNGKGQIFVKGEVIKTVPESQIVETLIEEAMRLAEGMEPVEGCEPVVSVS